MFGAKHKPELAWDGFKAKLKLELGQGGFSAKCVGRIGVKHG